MANCVKRLAAVMPEDGAAEAPGRRLAAISWQVAPSLPWIGALPPCPPAMMQPGSLHGSTSYGASLGQLCNDPAGGPHPGGCRCPVEAVKHEWASSWCPVLRRGAGHSRLTAGHRCPSAPRWPRRSSRPVSGGGRVLPRSPSSVVVTNGTLLVTGSLRCLTGMQLNYLSTCLHLS